MTASDETHQRASDPGPDADAERRPGGFHAWNPGLSSDLPPELLPLSTLFRPENSTIDAATANALSDFCGLPPHQLTALRVERLIVHELLIRVAADLSVPDGAQYEDLGHNFRRIAAAILDRHVTPRRAEIASAFDAVRAEAKAQIEAALVGAGLSSPTVAAASAPSPPPRRGWFRRARAAKSAPAAAATQDEQALKQLWDWRGQAETADTPLARACFRALSEIVSAVMRHRGRLLGDSAHLADLALALVCNRHGSDVVGDALDPIFRSGAEAEGFDRLPRQDHPIVLNVKGASASGKSTLRPLQRELVQRIGADWRDFALISPDVWRKFLLDYDSLGDAAKYAGTLTGHELSVVDEKLDRYMARKAERHDMTHLLIDRFRFDSFRPETDRGSSSKLLTRFGDLVYLFFMVTPPAATVERAWFRGLQVGRYKAVDDLLYHNVEAYTGMPDLFLTWARSANKRVNFEFLDNSVPQGARPKTIAFGRNGDMRVLDVTGMLNIARFKKVNIAAKKPEAVFDGAALGAGDNVAFLRRCAQHLKTLTFCDQATGRPYARVEAGAPVWVDPEGLAQAQQNTDVATALSAIGVTPGVSPSAQTPDWPGAETPGGDGARADARENAGEDAMETVGAWGWDAGRG